MTPPKPTKNGPAPQRKDYPTGPAGQTAWLTDYYKWVELNKPTKPSGGSSDPKPVVGSENIEPTTVTNSGVRTDWKSFIDGTIVPQEGDQTLANTPYVSARLGIPGQEEPTAVVILPTGDGKGFYVQSREVVLKNYMRQISREPKNMLFWKQKLASYYRTPKAYSVSLRGGPITDKDTEFAFALKRALSEIAYDNFQQGAENVKNNYLSSDNFYTVNDWIQKRVTAPVVERTSYTETSYTTEADAIADFMREVQIQVGDPKLVDNVKELAQQYWLKVKKEEESRKTFSKGGSDPISGTGFGSSVGYKPPSAELLKEWRIQFITKGAIDKKKIISTGIRNVKPIDLQDAGGEIGDNYTKLKGYSFDYGVRISDAELIKKASEASLPGGSIEEQKRTMLLASRLKYPALGTYIEGGLKVKEIATPFITKKQKVLELSDGSVDTFDPDVQWALSRDKLPGDIEYETRLRSLPQYRNTRAANEYAADLIHTMTKMWGKVG